MNYLIILKRAVLLLVLCFALQAKVAYSQKFIHPGINQTAEELGYMKKQVLAGEEPWKTAFENLKSKTDLDFIAAPVAHILQGAYGNPDIGGKELSKSASFAYDCSLLWYITGEQKYADKAIETINAWSNRLWDFDYNNAKLNAALTGHQFCNAAEILRYSESGWQQKDIDQFSDMLKTAYYPLLRFYFTRANGNWDGAIMYTLISIAVFTDDYDLFENVIDHFVHAEKNGSIFKYIYPSGQCQESTRDQGHVQMGLREFSGAARVAFTQGVDFLSLADNRIGLGFEYTAQFLLGHTPQCYGIISERKKSVADDNYEYIYRHYLSSGVELLYTKQVADSIRPKASRTVLTAFHVPNSGIINKKSTPQASSIAYPAGALERSKSKVPQNAIMVKPGESLQDALNAASKVSGWVVAVAGVHILPATLIIPDNITLSGEGLATILTVDPNTSIRDAMKNASPDMQNVTICDLVIEGAMSVEPNFDPNSKRSFKDQYNRGGILFHGNYTGQLKNIRFKNITVRNCTYSGVVITGADKIEIDNCNFDENGGECSTWSKVDA